MIFSLIMISVHYIGNFFFRLLLLSLLCVIHRGFMLSCSIGRTVLQPFYINSFCIIIIKWQTIVFFLSSIFCSIAWARRSKTIALLFSISRHMKRHITHILQLKPFFSQSWLNNIFLLRLFIRSVLLLIFYSIETDAHISRL